MHRTLLRFRNWASALRAALRSVVSGLRHRISVPGDVRAYSGGPVAGCTVELLVRRQLSDSWSVYSVRKATTRPDGSFSFSVLRLPGASYRLRVAHPGYHQWVLDAPLSWVPRHVPITLLRARDPVSNIEHARE